MSNHLPSPDTRDWPKRLTSWLKRNWAPAGSSTGDPAGTASSVVAAHVAAPDPHTQYTTAAEAYAAAQSALSSHVGLVDPHTQYVLKTAAASSFAPLVHTHVQTDVAGLVTALSGLLTSAVAYALAQSAVSVHAAQADPHSVYRLKTEAIAVTAISASGTPSNSTYLRGDGQWTSVSASVNVGNSITSVGGTVQMVNDTSVTTPNSFYGINGAGALGYLPGHLTVRITSDSGTQTTSALTNAVGLSFPVSSSTEYVFDFWVMFQSAGTSNGIKLALTYPTVTRASATALIPVAADANNAMFTGWITTSGDAVVGTGVQAANTTYCARIFGGLLPSANGTLQVQFGGELTTTTGVTVKAGSAGILYRV